MIDFLQNINIFIDLVKYKSVNNYKQSEKISASKIWRSIDALENHLKTKLIFRGSHECISLTDEGIMLYNRFVIPNDRFKVNAPENYLYILCTAPIIMGITDSLFSEEHPYNIKFFTYTNAFVKLCLNNTSDSSIENYINGYDIVYLNHETNIPHLESWKRVTTLKIKQKLFAHKSYIKANPNLNSIEDLVKHKFISDQQQRTFALFSEQTDDISYVSIDSDIYSESFEFRLQLLKDNCGITFLPATMITPSISEDLFSPVLDDYYLKPIYISVYVNTHISEKSTQLVNEYIHNLSQRYQSEFDKVGQPQVIQGE
jgi:DNA-binding transcriptional LysR family regulator